MQSCLCKVVKNKLLPNMALVWDGEEHAAPQLILRCVKYEDT
jgi:hypothetical protein